MPVIHDQLWNEWVEEFDVFISYARKDNEGEPKMVSAFVATLEDDFRQFSPAVPLKVFFDKKSILDGQYWQDVLRKGLRQSKVMIAFLSEAYFLSEWCRNPVPSPAWLAWDQPCKRQPSHLNPSFPSTEEKGLGTVTNRTTPHLPSCGRLAIDWYWGTQTQAGWKGFVSFVYSLSSRHEVADVAVLRPRDWLTAPVVLPTVSY
jgi:hypothetical protein